MKKSLKFALMKAFVLVIVIASIAAPIPVHAVSSLKAGDCVQFGKYSGEPILWRVIDFDKEGDPLLFSKNAICEKAFGGPELIENGQKTGHCTNSWKKSAVRAWLNSDAGAGKVEFPYGYPYLINEDTGFGAVPYDQEAGFVSDGNFTKQEKSLIKEVTQKSLLTKSESGNAEGGTELYNKNVFVDQEKRAPGDGYYDTVANMVGNFDKAYYEKVTDKMFLLDISQLLIVVTKFKEDYASYKNGELQDYLLRTPDGVGDDLMARAWLWAGYHVKATEPTVDFSYAHVADGVRPAFYLDQSVAVVKSGKGTPASPYVLTTGTIVSNPAAASSRIKVDINGSPVQFDSNFGFPFVDGASRTQVPLRITMESYGAKVDFDVKTSTAIVSKEGIEVRVPVGQKYIERNGKKIVTDTVAQIKDGRTYLPIRAVIEALAGQVSWDNANKTVKITSAEAGLGGE